MYEDELVSQILNNPIIAFDINGKVIFWNNSSEKLFKYKRKDVIGKYLPFITSTSKYEIEAVISKTMEGKQMNFKTQKRDKQGNILDLVLFTSPIRKENKIIGVSAIIKESSFLKNLSYIPLEDIAEREQKRTFVDIRKLIIISLEKSKKTINQIALDSGVNWKTVEKHLTYMIGKRLVNEVFSSEYVRVFELTEQGKACFEIIKKESRDRIVKKLFL